MYPLVPLPCSISLDGDFYSLYDKHKKANTDDLVLREVRVSTGPQGPWQSVNATEPLTVLRDLGFRHIIFKVDEQQQDEAVNDGDGQLRNAFDVLKASQSRRCLPEKKKG